MATSTAQAASEIALAAYSEFSRVKDDPYDRLKTLNDAIRRLRIRAGSAFRRHFETGRPNIHGSSNEL